MKLKEKQKQKIYKNILTIKNKLINNFNYFKK